MIHILKWSRAQVCSLSGQDAAAVIYLPDLSGAHAAYALHDGAKTGEPLDEEHTERMRKIYLEVEPLAKDIDGLIIMWTEVAKSALSAVAKLREKTTVAKQ